jgi:UrcA family protein
MNTSNQHRLSTRWLLASALLTCALAAGTASAAKPWEQTSSVKVTYGDLDISKVEGATRLYSRIKRAARNVCGADFMQPEEQFYINWKPCYEQAIATAVARVNSPMLTAVHTGKASEPQLAAVVNGQPSGK